ncbi:hypothetical protein G2W53_019980 [Senna tora]|uniref:Uncharacterized protein n=1 Tax=Senna tora TaxID=362788 RepID=A0A834WR73_9FABA|nr:hypothetical protein G2W53_019980 [Senna tora]
MFRSWGIEALYEGQGEGVVCYLSVTWREKGLANISTSRSLFDVAFKHIWVLSQRCGCIMIKGILRIRTGFQSSPKMLRQTFPSKSMFGWYTCNANRIVKADNFEAEYS